MKFTLLKEFKEFAIKGNMIDIAIGVIIGAAFNKVVEVLVKEIFFPPLAFLSGGANFDNKRIILRKAVIESSGTKIEEIAIGYGKLIGAGIDFLIIGITIFIVVKFMNSLRQKADDPEDKSEVTPKDIELLQKISELMEKQVGLLEQSKIKNEKDIQ